MDGWKTILSFWEGIIFRGSCWTSGLQSFLPKFVQGHEVRQETHHCWAPQQYGGCQFENIAPKPMRVGVQHFPEILAFGTQSKIINGPKDGSNIDARLWELDMVNWNLLLHTYICTCIYNMSYACIPRSSIGRRENEFRNLQRCGTVYFSFTYFYFCWARNLGTNSFMPKSMVLGCYLGWLLLIHQMLEYSQRFEERLSPVEDANLR